MRLRLREYSLIGRLLLDSFAEFEVRIETFVGQWWARAGEVQDVVPTSNLLAPLIFGGILKMGLGVHQCMWATVGSTSWRDSDWAGSGRCWFLCISGLGPTIENMPHIDGLCSPPFAAVPLFTLLLVEAKSPLLQLQVFESYTTVGPKSVWPG
ncbi:hypothetical protein PanWU01x14_057680 [Parasponia andersonii]|uniref:Uncharacterized protein n=1 Tax=Parasponia andersonii TaxID=3476 RepID=A0A2P5DJY3_PARAD|nr:hypothetical protein PanWU01x14_057680 [Parasponia andersonii]